MRNFHWYLFLNLANTCVCRIPLYQRCPMHIACSPLVWGYFLNFGVEIIFPNRTLKHIFQCIMKILIMFKILTKCLNSHLVALSILRLINKHMCLKMDKKLARKSYWTPLVYTVIYSAYLGPIHTRHFDTQYCDKKILK